MTVTVMPFSVWLAAGGSMFSGDGRGVGSEVLVNFVQNDVARSVSLRFARLAGLEGRAGSSRRSTRIAQRRYRHVGESWREKMNWTARTMIAMPAAERLVRASRVRIDVVWWVNSAGSSMASPTFPFAFFEHFLEFADLVGGERRFADKMGEHGSDRAAEHAGDERFGPAADALGARDCWRVEVAFALGFEGKGAFLHQAVQKGLDRARAPVVLSGQAVDDVVGCLRRGGTPEDFHDFPLGVGDGRLFLHD